MPAVTQVRQTGLIAQVIDENLNSWEDLAGRDINIEVAYKYAAGDGPEEWEQAHWSYRGQAAMCRTKTHNGIGLDGATEYVTFGDVYDFAGALPFSAAGWVYLKSWQVGHIIHKQATANDGWYVRINANGSISLGRSGSTIDVVTTAPSAVPMDEWFHLAVTYWAAGNSMSIWINGVASVSGATTVSLVANAQNLTFGRQSNGSAGYLDGKLFGWAIWSRTLSSAEIPTLYGAQGELGHFNKVQALPTSLSSYWEFGEATGNFLDSVGAIQGTPVGTITRDVVGPFIERSIVRVRIGDGTLADRQLYVQEIGDPSSPVEWTTWTLLYSGDHYAVAIEGAPTTDPYRVTHSKSDGIYVNNVLKITVDGVVRIKPITYYDKALYYAVVDQDFDGDRALIWWYVQNVVTPSVPLQEAANYRWYREDIGALLHFREDPLAAVFVIRSTATEGGARNKYASQVLASNYWFAYDAGIDNEWSLSDVVRGPSGQAGFKTYSNIFLTSMTGGYYLFFSEQHRDQVGNVMSNLRLPLMWCRAQAGLPQDWSEATPVGYSIWGFAGAVEFGAYIYVAGSGRTLRRPVVPTVIDISNYVIEGSFDIPRDNEKGTGSLTCANPNNVVGEQLGLVSSTEAGFTERRFDLQLGMKEYKDTEWTWKRHNVWWVDSLSKTKTETSYRLNLSFSDFWHRLENPFRDTISLPGNLDWNDWQVGGANQPYNYTNETAEFLRVPDGDAYKLRTLDGDTLFTGWRGENGFIGVSFSTISGRVLFRYQDNKNYYYASFDGTKVRLGQVSNGDTTILSTVIAEATAGFWLEVEFRWKNIKVDYNFQTVINHRLANPLMLVGFCGVGKVSDLNFDVTYLHIREWARTLKTSDLIRKLLYYVEEFAVYVSPDIPDSEQLNVIWGPQSDLDTPAKAFQQLLSTTKIDVAWRPYGPPDDPTTPYVWVSRFEKEDPDYTIEDQVFEYAQVNSGQQRANVVVVDGNQDSWIEYDRSDLTTRDRTINAYFDMPELKSPGEVRARAQQEIVDARRLNSPGGNVVWHPDYTRKDAIFWVDEDGNQFLTTIEGLGVEFNQSLQPFQHATIDTGTFIYCPPDVPVTFLARDTFQRLQDADWGTAQVGGTWVIE